MTTPNVSHLFAAEFHGLWDSLVYDADVKQNVSVWGVGLEFGLGRWSYVNIGWTTVNILFFVFADTFYAAAKLCRDDSIFLR